jgi:hypothetical protein
VTVGADLTFSHGVIEPAAPTGGTRTALRAMLSPGFAATLSTDKRRTVAPDPASAAAETKGADAKAVDHDDERRGDGAKVPSVEVDESE